MERSKHFSPAPQERPESERGVEAQYQYDRRDDQDAGMLEIRPLDGREE